MKISMTAVLMAVPLKYSGRYSNIYNTFYAIKSASKTVITLWTVYQQPSPFKINFCSPNCFEFNSQVQDFH